MMDLLHFPLNVCYWLMTPLNCWIRELNHLRMKWMCHSSNWSTFYPSNLKMFYGISVAHSLLWWPFVYCMPVDVSQRLEQFHRVAVFSNISPYPMDFHTMMDLKQLSFVGTVKAKQSSWNELRTKIANQPIVCCYKITHSKCDNAVVGQSQSINY